MSRRFNPTPANLILPPKYRNKIKDADDGKRKYQHCPYNRETAQEDFLAAVRQYARTENGDRPLLRPWLLQALRLLAEFTTETVSVTGAAQTAKSVGSSWLVQWAAIDLGYRVLWVYPTAELAQKSVPNKHGKIFELWLEAIAYPKTKEKRDVFNKHVAKGTIEYTWASTSKQTSRSKTGAAAGTPATDRTADMLVKEERSQWPPGTDSPFNSRVLQSRLGAIVRNIGTKGAGGGIEQDVKRATHWFYPHAICPSCEEEMLLDPKGCLLKASDRRRPDGSMEKAYLSPSGRPVEWFHSDRRRPVDTAFFGCPHCGDPIPHETRLELSYFRCRKTGLLLADFLANPQNVKVAIDYAATLRENANAAARIIAEGIETNYPEDWQQQFLGHESETFRDRLTEEDIRRAIGAPIPSERPYLLAFGIDQGGGQYWLSAVGLYQPIAIAGLRTNQLLERSRRVVFEAGAIPKEALVSRIARYQQQFPGVPVYVVIDNEPEIAGAHQLTQEIENLNRYLPQQTYWAVICDQRPSQIDDLIDGKAHWGGVEYPCLLSAERVFFRRVQDLFLLRDCPTGTGLSPERDGFPLIRLPQSWEQWLNKPADASPIKHLGNVSYDPQSKKWQRERPFDIFMSLYFAEVAIAKCLQGR